MIPEELKLYPFQAEDVERMDSMPHVLLFSEMGTGKTIETLIHVHRNSLYPALVLCPRSLKLNWFDEIERWTGIEPFYADTADEIVNYYFDHKVLDREARQRFFVLHHEALAYTDGDPVRELLSQISWKVVAVDECQQFRNPHTNRTQALLEFNPEASKFIFISGTPIVNSTFDLYPLLKLIKFTEAPGEFMRKYCRGKETPWGFKVLGSVNTPELLGQLAPIYIRRLKSDPGVLDDLPPKIYQTIKLEMPPDQREVYDRFVEMMCIILDEGVELTAANILAQITRLRQLSLDPNILGKKTDSSKTKAVLELIDQSPDEKWVVVSTSKQFVDFLGPKIKNSITFTGDDNEVERHAKEKSFKLHPDKRVLLITMKTGGLGLNLQVASNVIITDPWWNRPTIEQAIDRLHRAGQKKSVMVYELENDNSIDQQMKEAIAKKAEMSDEIVVSQEVIRRIYESRRGKPLETRKDN